MPQNHVQIVLGGFNDWTDHNQDDASLIVTTVDGNTYTIGLGHSTQSGVLYDMGGNPVGTVEIGHNGQVTLNLTVDGSDSGSFIDSVEVSSGAAWWDPSSNDFYIDSITGGTYEPPAAWNDSSWDPTDWGLPADATPTFESYLQYLYPDEEGGFEGRFEAFMEDYGDAYFPLSGDGPSGFFLTYPDGPHSDVITTGNVIANDIDVDNDLDTLRMSSIDYVGSNEDADPTDGVDDGEIGTGVNPDGSLITGANEPGFDFDPTADPAAYVEVAGKYGILRINALGDYEYILDPDLADHLEEGQVEQEVFEYTIVDPEGATSNTSTLTITVVGTNDAPVAVPDANDAIEKGDGIYTDPLGGDTPHDFTTVTEAKGNVLTDDLPGYDDPDDGSALDLDHDGDVEGDALSVVGIYSHGTQTQQTFDIDRVDADGNPVTDGFGPDEGTDTVVDDGGASLTIEGQYGTLVISADGEYTYTPNEEATDFLNYGDQVQDTFTYMVMDEHGAIDHADLTITVHGGNDKPEAHIDRNGIFESTGGSNFDVATDDLDGHMHDGSWVSDNFSISAGIARIGMGGEHISFQAGHGWLTDGSAIDGLGVDSNWDISDTETDTGTWSNNTTQAMSIDFTDPMASVTVTLSAFFQNGPDGSFTEQARLVAYDADGNQIGFVDVNGTPSGVLEVTLDGDSLGSSALIDHVVVMPMDNGAGHSANNSDFLIQNVSGTTSEAVAQTHGNVLWNDTDVDNLDYSDAPHNATELSVVDVQQGDDHGTGGELDGVHYDFVLQGQYGTLYLQGDGSYTYVEDPDATDFLNYGDWAKDEFTYTVSDNEGGAGSSGALEDQSKLIITVLGSNDAPVASNDYNHLIEASAGESISVAAGGSNAAAIAAAWAADGVHIEAGGGWNFHDHFNANDWHQGTLTANDQFDGLGVNSRGDINDSEADTMDGNDFYTEALTITFDTPMDSVDITLSALFNSDSPNDGGHTEKATLIAYDADGNWLGSVTVYGTESGMATGHFDADALGADIARVVAVPDSNHAGNSENNSDFYIHAVSGEPGQVGSVVDGNVIDGFDWFGEHHGADTDVDNSHEQLFVFKAWAGDGNGHGPGSEHAVTVADFNPFNNNSVEIQGQYGTLTLHEDGSYTYEENPDLTDPLPKGTYEQDVFTYEVADGRGGTDTATLTIGILGTNDAPEAQNDYNHLIEAAAGESVSVAAGGSNAAAIAAAWAADGVHIEAGGGWNFHGHFNANDWHQGTLTANDQFDGLGVNSQGDIDDSEADTMDGNDFYTEALTITFDTPMDSVDITLSALFNSDSLNDGGNTERALLIAYDADGNQLGSVTVYGTESGMATGHFDADALGADIARVVAVPDSNGAGNSENNSDFYIHAVSGEPGQVGSVVDGNVIDGFNWYGEHYGTDTDVDTPHDQLFITRAWAGEGDGTGSGAEGAEDVADHNPHNNNSVEIQGEYGLLTIHEDGSYTYEENTDLTDPLPKGSYEQDVFTYEVSDGQGGTDTATLTIGIHGTNDAPVAQDDYNGLTEATGGESIAVAADGSNAAAIAAAWAADGVTVTAGTFMRAFGSFNPNSSTLTANDNFDGLGVHTEGDINDGEVDTLNGNDFKTEALSIGFEHPMDSVDITLSALFNRASGEDGGHTERALLIAYDADGNQLGTVTVRGTESGMATGHFDSDALGGDIARVVVMPDANHAGDSANNSDFYVHSVSGQTGQVGSVVDGNVIDGFDWHGGHYGTDTDVDTPHDQLFVTKAWAGEGDGTGSGPEGAENVADHNPYTNNSVQIQGQYGLLTLHEDGSYTYEENPDLTDPLAEGAYEQDVFTYEVSDGQGGTDTATLTIGIHGTNDAAIITESDVVEATEDHNVNQFGQIVASGTLDVSDVDNPGNIIEHGEYDTVNHGYFHIDSDGNWFYAVSNGQDGSPWHNNVQTLDDGETLDIPGFTVTTDDGTEYTVHPVVNGINDAPVAFGDALGGSVEVHVTNFAEADGQATWEADGMTFTAMRNGHPDGHLVANDDGSEGNGMLGVADYVDGDPIDGNHGTDSVRIDFDHGMTSVTIGLSDYADSGQDWDDVNFVIRGTDGTELGTVEVRGTDTHVFTFTSNDTGGVPIGSIEVQATDDTDNFYIDYVNGDGDMYFEDGGSIELDASQILGNDFDVDIEDLTIGNVYEHGYLRPIGGDVTLNPDGSVTFTPDANFHGEASFWYQAYDGTVLSNPAKVTIQIAPVNDAPVAIDDTASTNEDTLLTVSADSHANWNLLSNDSDVDGDDLSVTSFKVDGDNATYNSGDTATLYHNGTEVGSLTINSDGTYTFDPADNYDGTVPTVTYTVSDGNLTDTANLNITINPVNDPVTANDDGTAGGTGLNQVFEDGILTVSGNVITNDEAPDGWQADPIAFDSAGSTSEPGFEYQVAGTYGTLFVEADGSYTYKLDNDLAQGLDKNEVVTETFGYTATDVDGSSDTADLIITLNGSDDGVIALDDGTAGGTGLFEVVEDGTPAEATVSGNVITNDEAPDGWQTDSTSGDVTAISFDNASTSSETGFDYDVQGTYGTLHVNADGTFRYDLNNDDPDLDNLDGVTTETFGYTATDSDGSYDTANLIITVNGVSDATPPVAVNDVYDNNPESDTYGFNVVTEAGVNVTTTSSNYLIMLDRSRSMSNQNRIEPAEDAIVSMLQKLQSELPVGMEVKIGMVDFSDNASTTTFTLVGGNPNAPTGLNYAISQIDTGDTGLYTNYDAAFQQGYAWALAHPGATQAIFISDGDPTTDLSGVNWWTLSEDLGDLDGVDLTAVAIGGATDMDNLNHINEDGNATVIADGDSDGLQELLVQIVDETSTDMTTAEGNVLNNDYDPDNLDGTPNDELSVIGVKNSDGEAGTEDNGTFTIEGEYGTLTIHADGHYTYTPDQPAADALNEGDARTDTFTYTIEDADGLSNVDGSATDSEGVITFLVNGANDGVVAIGDMNAVATLTTTSSTPTEWVHNDGAETHSLEIKSWMLDGEQEFIDRNGIRIEGSSEQDFDLVWSGGGLGIATDESSEHWGGYNGWKNGYEWDDADNGVSDVTHDWWSNWGYGQGGSENHPEGLTISFDQSQGKVVIDLNGVGYGESVTAYAYNGTTLVDTATTTWNNSSLELIDPNFSRTDAQTLITRVVLVGESGTSYTLDSVTTYGADTWTEQDLPPVTTYAAAPVTGFLQTNDYDVDTAGALSVALLDATGTWGDLTLDANMQYTYTPNIDAMNDSSTPPTDSFVETFTYEVTSPDGTTDIGTLLVPVNLNPSATVSLDSGTGIDNAFTGTNANEVIDGQTGSDTIHGGGGDDLIYGGEGNDILNGGGGDDIIFGGAGDDTINVSTGHDVIGLGEGKDVVQVDVSYLANNGGAEVTIADFSEKDGDVLDLNLDSGDTNSYILNFQEVLDDATATGSHYLELTVTDNNSATEDIVIKIMGAHIAHDAPTSGLTIDSNTIDDVIQQIIDSPDNT
jgi:VCBS repeat-containing protein